MDLYQIFITHNRAWALQEVIIFLILFLCAIGAAYILVRKKKIYLSQAVSGLAMLLFLGAVFGSTVFTREPKPYYEYKLGVVLVVESGGEWRKRYIKGKFAEYGAAASVGGLLPWVRIEKYPGGRDFWLGLAFLQQ